MGPNLNENPVIYAPIGHKGWLIIQGAGSACC